MRITPGQTSYTRQGSPPVFEVETGGATHFAVEVSSERCLLNGAAKGRRSATNFFNSRIGDAFLPVDKRPAGEAVAGQKLEAPEGFASYLLPEAAWNRLKGANQLFYRLLTSPNANFTPVSTSLEDVQWEMAPFISVSHLPARPTRSPVSRLRGRGALGRADLLDHAQAQVSTVGVVQGRDLDFCYVFLDSRKSDLTVVQSQSGGLAATLESLPLQPDAVINGPFTTDADGNDTEGEVIHNAQLIHASSQPDRRYVAQTDGTFQMGLGDPSVQTPAAQTAFGGLGALLTNGLPSTLSPWDQEAYELPASHGRGAIALHRSRELLLLISQTNNPPLPGNAMTMEQLQNWLVDNGFDEAVFNQGGEAETLFARSAWLVLPSAAQDKAIDFAIGLAARA
jgi:hypothetical protein